MAMSPVGNPPPMSSTSPPPAAIDFNTSGSKNPPAKIIGGSVGGGGLVVVLLVVIFLFLRRRRNQRLRDWDKAAAALRPFSPTAPVLDPPHERKETPSMPTTNQKVVQVSDHWVIEPTRGQPSIDSQQPDTERGGGETSNHGDDNRPVDQASYRAMQTQIQLLMQRMERMEAVDETPPEYVSTYGNI
ncbi:hypothetical protein PM082_014709 [Marasmius tenuissimus]|nr:hypothetical protein PM082_014709 [Marasmius tenuissimus]